MCERCCGVAERKCLPMWDDHQACRSALADSSIRGDNATQTPNVCKRKTIAIFSAFIVGVIRHRDSVATTVLDGSGP